MKIYTDMSKSIRKYSDFMLQKVSSKKTNYPKSYNSPKSRLLLVIIGIVSSQLASTVIEPGQLLMLNLKMGVSLVPQGAQKSQ